MRHDILDLRCDRFVLRLSCSVGAKHQNYSFHGRSQHGRSVDQPDNAEDEKSEGVSQLN